MSWSAVRHAGQLPEDKRMLSGRRHISLALLSALLLSFLSVPDVLSAPVPPKLVVNHTTEECGEIFGGDECMDCFPEEGWEVLGLVFDEGVQCPEGYARVDPPYTCKGFKAEFCCTEYHSGAAGDCDDLVVNRRAKSCAFVVDIEQCALPRGWESRAEAGNGGVWQCPADFAWTDQPACQSPGSEEESLLPLALLILGAVTVVLIGAIVAITLVIRHLRA
jgi:hypothetical protein